MGSESALATQKDVLEANKRHTEGELDKIQNSHGSRE